MAAGELRCAGAHPQLFFTLLTRSPAPGKQTLDGDRNCKAWSRAQALAYLREQRGKHFEPRILDAFLKIIDEG